METVFLESARRGGAEQSSFATYLKEEEIDHIDPKHYRFGGFGAGFHSDSCQLSPFPPLYPPL